MDDDALPPPREPPIVADISRLSVDEIEQRIVGLKAEIARLETALKAKLASRAAADAAFKL
ncbi:DUF1192 domain-containing protein [Xanthobacter autotrophicus]|nr:DUF1192 domain-containing protein [Xanthobacter autotrophicus]MDI4658983.1 DUF1192 domain-containing protein [Xanthobacter autotrophicus]